MHITAKQFALSLYESVDGKSAAQVSAVIKSFVELLAKRNSLALADKIVKEFERVWREKQGIVEAEVVSVNELSREIVKLLKDYVAKLSGAKKVEVEEKIDKNILGGVVIKYGDKVLDGSLKGVLAELKEKLIK